MNFPVTSLNPKHVQEWRDSGVSDAIIALNVRSIGGQEAIERILSDAIAQRQKVTSYTTVGTAKLLEHYKHLEQGGWWVSGLDPLNDWASMQWGQLKPDTQRMDPYKPGKQIKYEQPLNTETHCLFLQVPCQTTIKTAIRLGLEYGERFSWAIEQALQRVQKITGHKALAEAIQAACERDYPKASLLLAAINPTALAEEDPDFWCWVNERGLPVTLTEGAKKAGSLLTAGIIAIAIPGITMGARREDSVSNQFRLHKDLEPFATPGREISLCFDFETKFKTIVAIERETEKLKGLFSRAGCDFRIIELPGPEKGVDDFLVAQGESAFFTLFASRLSSDRWQAKRLSRLTHPATVTLNQRYLGNLQIPESAKLVLVKSAKGTGKTESFKEIVDEATQNGQRVLLISHRVQLAQAICDRVGLPYITELKTAEEGALLGYGLCVDSLHPDSQARFNAESWHDAIVIIDECEQVIWHLLDATTEVSSRRTTVLSQLTQLLQNTLESDRGRIILSDADLSNQTLDFVWGITGHKVPPHLILNTYKPNDEAWQIWHYRDRKPDQWLAALHAEIASGGKPFIVTQSQQAKSLWGTTTLERNLSREFANKKFLRIDSQTISDPSHPAYLCTSKLNEIAAHYDGIIASPSIETGVSIDIQGHFSSVWGCLNGVTAENSARQSLARVREAVPRHVWIAPRGISRVGNGSASVKAILSAEYQVSKITSKLVQTISFDEELLGAYSTALKAWAKMAARINAGMVHYRDTILDGLRDEGHSLFEAMATFRTGKLIDQLKEDRDQKHEEECNAIAEAGDISQKEFEELKGKKAKSADERHKERKFQVAQRYQVEVTPDLIRKDDDGWYPKLRLYYYLGIGKGFLKERDEQNLDNTLKTSGPWLPTLNRSQLSTRVWLLERLGIPTLLDLDEMFTGGTKSQDYANAHPALLKLADLATKHSWEVKCGLGVTVSEKMSPIQIAQTILGKLGIKLQFVQQIGGRGDRQRLYRYELPKDGRDAILAGWFARDESARQQSVHTPGIDIENREGVA